MGTASSTAERDAPAERARASAALAAGSSVVLVGESGIGKTHLAGVLAAELAARGTRVVRLAADRSATTALAVFAPLYAAVAATDDAATPTAFDVLARIRAAGDGVVLWVDDLHWADAQSAAVVADLARYHGVVVLATARPTPTLPEAVERLWRDAIAQRVDVPRRTVAQSRTIVADRVAPRTIAGEATAALHERSRGNPLHLTTLVDALLASGGLVDRRGVLVWDGAVPVHGSVVDLVRPEIGRLSPTARRALDLVAFAGALPIEACELVVGRAALDEAVAEGVVEHVAAAGRAQVHVAHPIYAEVAQAMLARDALVALARSARDAVLPHLDDLDAPMTLRLLAWAHASGDVVPATLLARATSAAARVPGDAHRETLALATVAHPDASAAERAAARIAVAEHRRTIGAGDPDVALADARAAVDAVPASERPALLARWAAVAGDARLHAGDVQGMLATMDATASDLADHPAATGLRLAAAGRLCYVGAMEEGVRRTHETVGDAPWLLPAELLASLGLSETMLGRHDASRATMQRVLATCSAPATFDAERIGGVLGCLVGMGVAAGDVDEAVATLAQLWSGIDRELAPREMLLPLRMHDAITAAAQGRWSDAAAAARLASAQFESADRAGLMRLSLAYLVLALAATGEHAEAAAVRAECARRGRGANAVVEPLTLWALSMASIWMREPGSVAIATDAADRCAAMGARLGELRALHVATLAHPDALVALAGRVADVAERVDGPASAAIADHVAARMRGDRAATDDAVRALARAGVWLPMPSLLGALSSREREIAAMAALGHSSKVIASRLVVSPRTVETHLTRAFAKLGISSRDDLSTALGLDAMR